MREPVAPTGPFVMCPEGPGSPFSYHGGPLRDVINAPERFCTWCQGAHGSHTDRCPTPSRGMPGLETQRHGHISGIARARCEGKGDSWHARGTWTLFRLPNGTLRCGRCYLLEEP